MPVFQYIYVQIIQCLVLTIVAYIDSVSTFGCVRKDGFLWQIQSEDL